MDDEKRKRESLAKGNIQIHLYSKRTQTLFHKHTKYCMNNENGLM